MRNGLVKEGGNESGDWAGFGGCRGGVVLCAVFLAVGAERCDVCAVCLRG